LRTFAQKGDEDQSRKSGPAVRFLVGRAPPPVLRKRILYGKREVVKVPVKSRIMIDAVFFRENNPNYVRSRFSGLTEKKSLDNGWFTLVSKYKVKSNDKEPSELKKDNLLLCSPTVREWSFGNKL
jgi:hypothetical protein